MCGIVGIFAYHNPALPASEVVFAGYVPEAEKADHYRLADANAPIKSWRR